ncbi:hypothetical protein F4802DRAFT_596606 [Xylaria palmicola]|nr:hypothetical protein F4802DRAFT_596606 [Xylaria palmicola]
MSSSTSKKRKLREPDESDPTVKTKKPRKTTKNRKGQGASAEGEEKRLRRFRAKAPASFDVIYHRATEQRSVHAPTRLLASTLPFLSLTSRPARFYVLGRSPCGTDDCPEERIEITGSTGNIYKVHIARLPSCDCPHGSKGNQCKHIIYVMSRVLRARHSLVYQLALLPSELREIFEGAPSNETDGDGNGRDRGENRDKNRKQIEGDCPICFTPFEGAEDTVYCRATCGQNMHKECFEMWAATKRRAGQGTVTCPMCRSQWQGDEDMVRKIKNTGIPGADGYVNIADQLGISRIRDESTYYDGPRRRHSSGYRPRFGYRSGR